MLGSYLMRSTSIRISSADQSNAEILIDRGIASSLSDALRVGLAIAANMVTPRTPATVASTADAPRRGTSR